jgi:UDP-N-acetylglucosamine 2-epimerase (non-hydrolysing)
VHRAENTEDAGRLAAILEGLRSAPTPVVLLAPPRLRARAGELGLELGGGSLVVTEPLAYPEMLAALVHSAGVVTDSGGLQKEAFLLQVPCTTVRTETEWVETVDLGWNVLCPDPRDLARALSRPAPQPTSATPYGSGDTAARIVAELERRG